VSSISRLQDTWVIIPDHFVNKFNAFSYLFKQNGNYKNYRNIVEDALLPLIPFQGVYQSDLTMFGETPDYIEKTGNINYEKMSNMAKGLIFYIFILCFIIL
jgi:hypothetical protein